MDDGFLLRRRVIVVVGGVSMDHVSTVRSLTAPGTSVQATAFEMNPGGRGLHLAVAAARMGFDARLAAAVGDDEAGGRVLEYLTSEGISTELITRFPGEATPIAQMIALPTGDTATIGWRNERRVAPSASDMQKTAAAIKVADAVLVTFEVPVDVIERVLENANRSPRKPLVLLQASPPLEHPERIHRHLASVDHVVTSEWALRSLLPEADERSSEEVARELNNLGPAVCIVNWTRCRYRSTALDADVDAPPGACVGTPGAQEAFSAALVARLLGISRDVTPETLRWACTAMTINP